MKTWASIAALGLFYVSVAKGGIMHYVTPGAIGIFAAGALVTGVLLLLVAAPRMLRKSRTSKSAGKVPAVSGGTRHAWVRPDYFAAPVGAASSTVNSGNTGFDPHGRRIEWPDTDELADEWARGVGRGGYHRRLRVKGLAGPDKRERRRLPPRHAAPRTRGSLWMSGIPALRGAL
jgi:hypothetical protein